MLLTKTFFLALSIAAVAASLYAATRRRPGAAQRPPVWTPGLDRLAGSYPRQQDNGRLAASMYDVQDAASAETGVLDLAALPADAPDVGSWRRLRTG